MWRSDSIIVFPSSSAKFFSTSGDLATLVSFVDVGDRRDLYPMEVFCNGGQYFSLIGWRSHTEANDFVVKT